MTNDECKRIADDCMLIDDYSPKKRSTDCSEKLKVNNNGWIKIFF